MVRVTAEPEKGKAGKPGSIDPGQRLGAEKRSRLEGPEDQ